MGEIRKRYSVQEKAKIALEALRGELTMSQISARYGAHSTQNRVNQVWSTDITYIRLTQGFVYLTAIIDWFSRYVLDFEVSTSLKTSFCCDTLERVLAKGVCDIFNTDQGAQFTASPFVNLLLEKKIQISMDGKGRALDNIFVERLWRSVKYEGFYNNDRPHQALGYKTPKEVYFSSQTHG